MNPRSYPPAVSDRFPEPPLRITDATGREVVIERVDPEPSVERLVSMYAAFDPADRAQGIPPVGKEKIRDWVKLVTDAGPDVIARVGTQWVGHATLVPENDQEYELAIFLLHEHQGRGIGTSLVRGLLGAAQADNIEFIWLTVERWNSAAIHVYESVGFETVDTASFELEMALRLDV